MFAIHTHVRRPLRRAFNLVELLVVIALFGVLMGLLLGAVQKVRAAANRITCQNTLKQLALAAHHHHDAKGNFPSGVTYGTTWVVELLPYLELDDLHRKWNYNDYLPMIAGGRNAFTAKVIKLLLCPSDTLADPVQVCNECGGFYAVGSYGGNAGTRSYSSNQKLDGIFFWDSAIKLRDVTDGASNTFLLGERSHVDKEFDSVTARAPFTDYYPLRGWGKWANYCYPAHHLLSTSVPINYQTPPQPQEREVLDRISAFGSGHAGGANFAYADASVRFRSDQTNLMILQALSTRAGSEVVDGP
jgi:prepilin-type N-terminal cleavage/methylation domain-containing protein/prepilin-type processing-associated H-X9-DG protein